MLFEERKLLYIAFHICFLRIESDIYVSFFFYFRICLSNLSVITIFEKMSKKDFLSVPTPGGLAPLNPNPVAMGTASATGNYLSDICNFKVLCIFKILHFCLVLYK